MAPEILHPIEPEAGRATVESDIYALAMTMYEVSQSEISLKGALAISHAISPRLSLANFLFTTVLGMLQS